MLRNMENLIGLTINNYKLISVLGKGGMGIVYKAIDVKLDRPVAVKMINSKLFNEERHIERFKREARNQARLNHPNIVSVYGFIEYDDYLGIVMEYVEGESLEKVLYRQKRFNIFDAIYILKQLLSGLNYAHSKGFVHRDIKPSNIIFNSEGVAKIMDFGISKSTNDKKFTKPGSKLGTVYYMSPEQVKGEEVDLRTDIYAVGCTFYEMLTSNPPFDYKSEYEVMDAHVKVTPPLVTSNIPGSPKIIDAIIQKSLQKKQEERYQDAYEVMLALNDLEKRIASLDESKRKIANAKSNRFKLLSVISVIAFLGVFIGFSYFIFDQVQYLLNSGKIEEFDSQHNLQSLFKQDEAIESVKVMKINTGVEKSLNSLKLINGASFILGNGGIFLTKSINESQWQSKKINTEVNLYDGYFSQNDNSFIIGDSSLFLRRSKSFEKWSQIKIEKDKTLFKIKFINENVGFVLGSDGFLLYTRDKGKNWLKGDIQSDKILYDVDFINSDTGFIVGWGGALYKTTNGGDTWLTMEPLSRKYLKSIDFGDESTGVIVGGGGSIFRTNNGGKIWYELEKKHPYGLQAVKFIDSERVIIVGNRGLILFSDNSGKTWKRIQTGYYTTFNDVEISPSGEVFLCGVNGIILKLF